MAHRVLIAAALVVAGVLGPARGQEAYKDAAGPYAAVHRDETWRDEARNRAVPVRVYTPRVKEGQEARDGRPGKFPVIVFSHGLGGSRNGYAYMGEHLASHGYIVIHPTHAGSDTEAVRQDARDRARESMRTRRLGQDGLLKGATSDPENLKNRPRDISFVIDQLAKDEKLSPIADVSRVGVGGHSFGAYTGFAVAGMTIDLPEDDGAKGASFRDERVKAVVAMSPQGAGAMGISSSSWEKVGVPVLSLTGSRDYGQGQRAAAWRREGFDATKGVDAMLVVIQDAAHGTFAMNAGSRLRAEEISKDHGAHIRYVKMVTTAYFDAYVRGDQGAKTWITTRELAKFGEGKACEVAVKVAGEPKKEGPPADR